MLNIHITWVRLILTNIWKNAMNAISAKMRKEIKAVSKKYQPAIDKLNAEIDEIRNRD